MFDGSLRDRPVPQRLEIPLDIDGNSDIKQIGMNFNTQLTVATMQAKNGTTFVFQKLSFGDLSD